LKAVSLETIANFVILIILAQRAALIIVEDKARRKCHIALGTVSLSYENNMLSHSLLFRSIYIYLFYFIFIPDDPGRLIGPPSSDDPLVDPDGPPDISGAGDGDGLSAQPTRAQPTRAPSTRSQSSSHPSTEPRPTIARDDVQITQ